MAEQGIAMVFKGERKNLRGRYHDGSCIRTQKGLFLYSSEIGWTKIYDSIAAFFDIKTVDLEMTEEENGTT